MDLLSSDSEEEKKLQKKAKKKTSSEADFNALRVNQKFASEFERRERYKELQRAKEISLDDDVEPDSESDESEDEEAELLSPGLDVKILQTINMLKKKDPKIYDPNAKWFSDPSEDEDSSDDDSDDDAGQKAEKKLRYKDVLRQQLIADGADDSDADSSAKNKRDMESAKKSQLLYDREQEELRKQFLKAAKNVDGSDADDDSDDDLLQVKHKSAAERAEEERAYQQALEEMKTLEKEKEAEETAFLHEFLSKKMWKDPTAKRSNAMDVDDEDDVGDDEDEEAFDEAERFESKYNFRFEELQAEQADDLSPALRNDLAGALLLQQSRNQVVGHARNIEDSVRRVDDKRKKQRESRKEKKEKEKRQKEAELKRLKNLKKQELQERLTKITEIGGLKELGIDERFLEEDWDPEKHEQLMAQQFGEDYYGQDDDDIAALHRVDEDEHYNVYEDDEGNVIADDDDADADGGVDVDEDGEEYADPETAKAAVSQLMDEYYALDYEDLIAGMPCRFKYRSVDPEDFGLTTEDILLADDKELNHYVSLKKLAPYDTRGTAKGSKDLSKKRKRLRAALKERLAAEEEAATSKQEKKAKKLAAAEAAAAAAVEAVAGDDSGEKKKRKRRKRKHRDGDDADGEGEGDGDDAGAAAEDTAAGDDADEAPPAKAAKKATAKDAQPQPSQAAHDDDDDDANDDDADAAAPTSAKPKEQKEKRKRHHKKKNKGHDGGHNKRSAPLNPAAEAKQQRLALYR